MLARLGDAERAVERGTGPWLRQASDLPGRIEALPVLLDTAGHNLEVPYRREWLALQADLEHAADYLRRQWQTPPDDSQGRHAPASRPTAPAA
jgi:hypothetical protein